VKIKERQKGAVAAKCNMAVFDVRESGTGQGLGPAIVVFIAYNCTTTEKPIICQFHKNAHFVSVFISITYKKRKNGKHFIYPMNAIQCYQFVRRSIKKLIRCHVYGKADSLLC
jgi:hypothetical protein